MEYEVNGLDLFSGIGGIAYALKSWVQPVAYCENEPYAQGVLLSRMESGELPAAPIWDDIRTLRGVSFAGAVDIISGGFPCQDISVAGAGEGNMMTHFVRLEALAARAHEVLSEAPTPRYQYFRTNWQLIETRLDELGLSHWAYFPTLCAILPNRDADIRAAVEACIEHKFTPDTTAHLLTLYKQCVKEALDNIGKAAKEMAPPQPQGGSDGDPRN